VAFLDCSEESRGERAEGTGVKERGEVLFGLGLSNGAICSMSNGTICSMPTRGAGCWVWRRWWEGWLGGQRNVPEAICGVAFADDDNVAVFVDLDVVLCEKGDTIVVAELTD
jgi:hypothetical protein